MKALFRLLVASVLGGLLVPAALAQAPGLKRDYEIVARTTDWHEAREINGFRFQMPSDRPIDCNLNFFFNVSILRQRPIDWDSDEAFDSAMVQLASLVEDECPNVEIISYSYQPGFQSVRKRDGWHILRVVERLAKQETAEIDAYYHQPLFPADGPNPLADRGYYASRLVARDGELALYQAFREQKDYARNGVAVILVLVHEIGPADPIVTLEKDWIYGGVNYPPEFIERLNGLLFKAGNKFAFWRSQEGFLYHYVSSYHVPPQARVGNVGPEQPFLISRFDLKGARKNGMPQIARLHSLPDLPYCKACGGTTSDEIGRVKIHFYEAGGPISAADLFPEAAR